MSILNLVRFPVSLLLFGTIVGGATFAQEKPSGTAQVKPIAENEPRAHRVVHVFVALCDNKNQGVVPVPAALGNGQDPTNNLYWGAQYGVKTFFKRAAHWKELPAPAAKPADGILDQAVFTGTENGRKVYVFAQAFDGARMKDALAQFLLAAAGKSTVSVEVQEGKNRLPLVAGGGADLVCFVGHDGFMDLQLESLPECGAAENPRRAVVLACKSRAYFEKPLKKAKCTPLVTTTGLMAPEAYTLDAVIRGWARGATPDMICQAAAEAYARYQKCNIKSARRVFATGWQNP